MKSLTQASAYHLADCEYRHLSRRSISSYRTYERALLAYLEQEGIDPTIHALNLGNVRGASLWVRDRQGGKRHGTHAAKQFVAIMKLWSRFLVDEDILEADYLARLRRPNTERGAREPFQTWEIQAIRGAFQGTRTSVRDLAMFALMLDTGARIGELTALTLDNLDLMGYRIRVVGKGGRERIIPFGSGDRGGGKTARAVRDYLKQRHPQRPTAQAFLSYDGRPLYAGGFRGAFKAAALKGGVQNAEPHRCRHTFATRYLIRHPNDVEGLRYLLGHLSDDTYRIYAVQAGQIIAQMAGRDSLFETLSDGGEPARRRG